MLENPVLIPAPESNGLMIKILLSTHRLMLQGVSLVCADALHWSVLATVYFGTVI